MSLPITIFHNNRCGTSRSTLALIREAGLEPTVVDYLAHPPTRATLDALAAQLAAHGEPALALVRTKETLFTELGLNAPGTTDDQFLDAIAAHPILLNRPVVSTPQGARVCRPAELVLELLPAA